MWDDGFIIVKDKNGEEVLCRLNKDLYKEIIRKDGDEVRLTKLNWQHCEAEGSDRIVLI